MSILIYRLICIQVSALILDSNLLANIIYSTGRFQRFFVSPAVSRQCFELSRRFDLFKGPLYTNPSASCWH